MGVESGYRQTESGVVPEDWDVKPLRDIGQLDVDNLQTSTRPDYEFNYVSIEDIDEGGLVGYTQIAYRYAPSRARRKMKQYDLPMSIIRPNVKAHLYVREDLRDFVCSAGFSVLRSDIDNYDPEYACYHSFGSVLNHEISSLLAGSNYPAVNRCDVREALTGKKRLV